MPRYAELIYNGFWFSPEREMLQALIDKSQEHVSGTVRVKLYKGGLYVAGRKSPVSLYNPQIATMDADPRGRRRCGCARFESARPRRARRDTGGEEQGIRAGGEAHRPVEPRDHAEVWRPADIGDLSPHLPDTIPV